LRHFSPFSVEALPQDGFAGKCDIPCPSEVPVHWPFHAVSAGSFDIFERHQKSFEYRRENPSPEDSAEQEPPGVFQAKDTVCQCEFEESWENTANGPD